MTEGIPQPKPAISTDDSLVFLVGRNHLLHVLMSSLIESQSGCKAVLVDEIADIQRYCTLTFRKQVTILYDCFGLSADRLEGLLLQEFKQLEPEWAPVLINLDRNNGIEKVALEFGVHGFFYEDESLETLLKGLSAILKGEFWVSRQQMSEIISEASLKLRKEVSPRLDGSSLLTRREAEILGMLSLGATNNTISAKLFISPHTVRTHLHHIFKKINVSNRLEAALWSANNLFTH